MAGRHSAPATTATTLLDLPDPCLLAVLQCFAEHPASLFSAARAYSRLHQAAVLALSRVAVANRTQQHVDSLLQYLDRHGQHVSSISLTPQPGVTVEAHQRAFLGGLPHNMRLRSLELCNLQIRVQPVGGLAGVLGAAGSPSLTQLRLSDCTLLDSRASLAAALALLPGLQHLSVCRVCDSEFNGLHLPPTVIEQLQQLAYLELQDIHLQYCGWGRNQPQGLTRLADLRLLPEGGLMLLQPDWLSGCRQLTRLVLSPKGRAVLHPGILAGHTQLQHFEVVRCSMHGGSAGVLQLLTELQTLQRLTHLRLTGMTPTPFAGPLPAAPFSALTASSRLQHLDISRCTVPTGVWQHMFPAGRQLPQLRSLDVPGVRGPGFPARMYAAAPAGALLLSCCPGLQSLDMWNLPCGAEELGPLRGLSRLSSLHILLSGASPGALEAVAQLTRLRQLTMYGHRPMLAYDPYEDGLLLQLTRLQHLTCLQYETVARDQWHLQRLVWQAHTAEDEPVWRQLLRHHLEHMRPEVAQQAAAALA